MMPTRKCKDICSWTPYTAASGYGNRSIFPLAGITGHSVSAGASSVTPPASSHAAITVTLRRPTVDDIPALLAVVSASWHSTYDPILGPERAATILARWGTVDAWQSTIAGSSISIVAIAEQGGSVVAMASGRMESAFDFMLHMVYVDPAHLRRGIGRRLITYVAEPFPTARCIAVEVLHANTAAIAFYRAQGFVADGEVADATSTTASQSFTT